MSSDVLFSFQKWKIVLNWNNCRIYTRLWVIPRQITQGPTWPVSDVSEKITKKYLNVF